MLDNGKAQLELFRMITRTIINQAIWRE